jgi:hypothetical protein
MKDYAYRSTWEHTYSRSINKARRNNLTKAEMMKQYGRFPKKDEWMNNSISEEEWIKEYLKKFPKPEK